MYRLLTALCTTLALAIFAPPVLVADEDAGVSGLMDETALAVVRIDIAAEEPASTFAALAFPEQMVGFEMDRWRDVFRRLLTAAGVRYVLLILHPSQQLTGQQVVPLEAVGVIPFDKAHSAELFAKLPDLQPPGRAWHMAARGRFCLFGPKELVTSALAGDHPPRPGLEGALAAAGDAPLALVIAASADQRRVLSSVLPELPAERGGNLLRQWASQAQWTTLALDPDRSFRLTMRTASPEDAIKLAGSLDAFLTGTLARLRKVAGHGVDFGPLVAALQRRVDGDEVTLSVDLQKLPPAGNPFRQAADLALQAVNRRHAMQQLKEIGIATQNYHDIHQHFPNPSGRDADGKPPLSWRVYLLPFLGEKALYDEFHLDEPWDSEHNRRLIERMPDVYHLAGQQLPPGKTCIELAVGPSTATPEGRGLSIRDFIDGTSNTMLAVETDDAHAVVWTQPADFSHDPKEPAAGLGGHFGQGFLTLSADGAVHFVPLDAEWDTLRALFTPAGEEIVKWPGQ